jgi:SAM-dependent methyltransferase
MSRPIQPERNGQAITPDRILEMGNAFRVSKVLFSAVELGVFTALVKGPADLAALKKQTGISERCAKDFFDSLVALGLLLRDDAGHYSNGPESELFLDCEKHTYIGGALDHWNSRAYPKWHFLTQTLKTGRPHSQVETNKYFPSLYRDPIELEKFAKGMTAGTRMVAESIAAAFDWSRHRTILDVGTAEGGFLVAIAAAHPHLTGVGFDLAEMRGLFEKQIERHGLSKRVRFQAGDFLRGELPAADVIVLGRVLHNWDLDTKKMLLRKAYEALAPGGALIIYERLIDDQRSGNITGLLASLHMAVVTEGGFDFTGGECLGWMQEVGFSEARIKPLPAQHHLIVGTKR